MPQTLSMVAAPISDHRQNLIQQPGITLLTSAAVYGANASGKSNLLRAMSLMRYMVVAGFEKSSVNELPYDPFRLHPDGPSKPTLYEIEFLIDGKRYRYGFEADQSSVQAEWLFVAEKKAEKPLFLRVRDGIEVKRAFAEGKNLEAKTRDNALFLSVVDQFSGKTAGLIMNWFRKCNVISGLAHETYRSITFQMLENPAQQVILSRFFRSLDLGFENIRVEEEAFHPSQLPADIPETVTQQMISELQNKKMVSLKTQHVVSDDQGQQMILTEFDASAHESAGTNKVIDLAGPVFATLLRGGVLVVDELDAKLHPLLTRSIIRLFQDPEVNRQGGQLVFATHDTNILSICNLRRDQIYFVEKNNQAASDLYSLVEYNKEGKVRKDRSFEKDYINGRYGAIPYIGDLDKLLNYGAENQG